MKNHKKFTGFNKQIEKSEKSVLFEDKRHTSTGGILQDIWQELEKRNNT